MCVGTHPDDSSAEAPMKATEAQIRNLLMCAIADLREKDPDLLRAGANERSLTHRLAVYLEQHLNKGGLGAYHVDCEYNRFYDVAGNPHTKTLNRLEDNGKLQAPAPPELTQITGSRVFPDVIVHKRGSQSANLLVVECKANPTSADAVRKDKRKLCLFGQAPFSYDYAAFVDLSAVGREIDLGPHEWVEDPP
jgi:RNA-splicing ligase RtcB